MGIPLVAGREFTAADNAAGPRVALVSEALVRRFPPNRNPLDRHLGLGGRAAPDVRIVGVVKDAKYSDMRRAPPPVSYTPLAQNQRWDTLCYYLRTAAGIGLTAATGKLVGPLLYGLKPWDALVYGSASALLWLVALAAACVPARRATSVDPMVALRYE